MRNNERERLARRKAYEQEQAAKNVKNGFAIDEHTVAIWHVPLVDSNYASMLYKKSDGYELKMRYHYYDNTKSWHTMTDPSWKDKDVWMEQGRGLARAVVAQAVESGRKTDYEEILMGEDGLDISTAKFLAPDDIVLEMKAGHQVNCSKG